MTEPKKPTPRRLYVIQDAKGDEHLINATSAAQAISHCYQPLCKVATPIEAANLSAAGVKIEEAA